MSEKQLTPEQIEVLQKENTDLKQANTDLVKSNTELTTANSDLQAEVKHAGKKTGKKLTADERATLEKELQTIMASGESHTTKVQQILELLGVA